MATNVENMISGRSYKLGDVLTSMDGTTVEINNTFYRLPEPLVARAS